MTTKKRGLGRGLESLLADTNTETVKSSMPLAETSSSENIVEQHNLVAMYKENHLDILREAEYLQQLLDDLETLLQHNK
ncbi:MAG: hypothetical protein K9K84_08605 [Methylovulum sp.]|jgi:hypothetical protein|nr:hypothetical protein [Methylovulum sp.]